MSLDKKKQVDILKEYYIKYLREIRESSESTIKHYIGALNVISKYLIEKKISDKIIYEVSEIEELEHIRNFLLNDQFFAEKDSRGHQMYSSALNNYCKFAIGEGLNTDIQSNNIFDYVLPRGNVVENTTKQWRRSSILKWQVIQLAHYKCEIDNEHKTFIAKSNNMPYMEGHHIIPMRRQTDYENSLDIYANIMCLCPVCHRMLHYGKDEQKADVLEHIYKERHKRMEKCGISINKNHFIDICL